MIRYPLVSRVLGVPAGPAGVFEAPLVKEQSFWSPGFGSQVPSRCEIKVTVWSLNLFPHFQVGRVPAGLCDMVSVKDLVWVAQAPETSSFFPPRHVHSLLGMTVTSAFD